MLVEVPPNGSAADAEQIARVRLLPNHPQLRFTGRVRESIEQSFAKLSLAVEPLPACIQRTSREHDPQTKEAKARRNIRIAEAEINDVGVQPRLLNCLGDALQTLKDNGRAAQFYRHALQLSRPGTTNMLEAYYGIITSLDDDPRHHEEQLAVCVKAIETFPTDAQLLCAMGGYLQRQGQTELAMKAYQTTYQFGQVNPGVWHVKRVHEIAALCYSLTLQVLQRYEEALSHLREASGKYPDSIRLRRQTIEVLIKLGQRDAALEEAGRLPGEFPNREAFRSAVRGACLASAGNWIAAKSYLKTAYNAGSRDPICLRWYATTLISSGEVEEARPIVQQWIELEPANALAQQYWTALAGEAQDDEAADRQVRIDGANVQQSHLPTSAARKPARSAATRMPHQK
jgi:tetratricopeptide (TPR) repeat protein